MLRMRQYRRRLPGGAWIWCVRVAFIGFVKKLSAQDDSIRAIFLCDEEIVSGVSAYTVMLNDS